MTTPRTKPHRHAWEGGGQVTLGCECGEALGPVEANALEGKAANLDALLRAVGDPANCRGCQAPIFWVIHRNNRRAPYTPEGLNHFATCPVAGEFKR